MTLHYMVTKAQGKLIQKSKPTLLVAGQHDVELSMETIMEGVLMITFVFDHIHYVTMSLIRQ